MFHKRKEKQFRAFYERWSVPVFTFCRLFLGDEARAHEGTREACLAYLRRGLALGGKQLPNLLLRCALDATKYQCLPRYPRTTDGENLESIILSLPCDQRAVFILRTVLEEDEESLAITVELPPEQVPELWARSLMTVRELLPNDLSKERIR